MSKRKRNADSESTTMKQWKEFPPGPEQLQLERMFTQNLIDCDKTPCAVQKTNPMFMEFSPKVFAAHFRKTKSKLGLYGM